MEKVKIISSLLPYQLPPVNTVIKSYKVTKYNFPCLTLSHESRGCGGKIPTCNGWMDGWMVSKRKIPASNEE
jgi:hypothetical protein